MKYSIDAFRRSLPQLERFRSVSDRICYWIYHDFPGREAYEAKYGIRILSGSEVAAIVSKSGNAAAINSFERMFRDETQVSSADFWTKSAIDEYFRQRIKPFLP